MTATLDRRADYVSAVAVELAGLAPDDRAELIEELDDHVAALLEDRPEVDLVTELGTPRAYAAELRSAAGLTGDRPTPPSWRQQARALWSRLDARVPAGLRPYLATLRPVWWVFRGYVLVAAVCRLAGASWGWSALVPAPGGLPAFGLLLILVGAAVSVRIGMRGPRSGARRGGIVALDVVAVLATLLVADGARGHGGESVAYDTQYVPNCPIELSNLYAYDASGRPLTGVRLYDQNGTPFDLSQFNCNAGRFAPGVGGVNAYPWPSASDAQAAEPTGPPASLAPLPGATVTPPGSTGTSSPTATPSGTPTP